MFEPSIACVGPGYLNPDPIVSPDITELMTKSFINQINERPAGPVSPKDTAANTTVEPAN